MSKHTYLFQRKNNVLNRVRYTDYNGEITNLQNTKFDSNSNKPLSIKYDWPQLTLYPSTGKFTDWPTANAYCGIQILENNNKRLAQFFGTLLPTGISDTRIYAWNYNQSTDTDTYNQLILQTKPDGTGLFQSSVTPSAFSYSNDVPTTKWCVSRYPKHTVTSEGNYLYVNEETGSDTADLHNGRGFSEDKPFKSIKYALNYATIYIVGLNHIQIRVCSDINNDLSGWNGWGPAQSFIHILSWPITTRRIINKNGALNWVCGTVWLDNLTFNHTNSFCCGSLSARPANMYINNCTFNKTSNSAILVSCYDSAVIVNNCIFNGVTAALYSWYHGKIYVGTGNANTCTFNNNYSIATMVAEKNSSIFLHNNLTLAGNATGLRFSMKENGLINSQSRGLEFIPGSIAGTMDSTSRYI